MAKEEKRRGRIFLNLKGYGYVQAATGGEKFLVSEAALRKFKQRDQITEEGLPVSFLGRPGLGLHPQNRYAFDIEIVEK